MSGLKKSSIPRQSSYNSLYVNPLNDENTDEDNQKTQQKPLSELKHYRSCSAGVACVSGDKENAEPKRKEKEARVFGGKENAVPSTGSGDFPRKTSNFKSLSTGRVLRPTSLEFCMQMNEPDFGFGSRALEPSESDNSSSLKIWDFSDSEAAPASSWATLPNRSLLCRPLPVDVGRCTCVILRETPPEGLGKGTLYSLYTNEGKGRQNRKLAVALYKRRRGRSEFIIAQNIKGILYKSDDSIVGSVTANLMGSKYHVWDKGSNVKSLPEESKALLAVVRFIPTITTWTGSYRRMRVYVPKHQSMVLKNTTQMQHISGLPENWGARKDRVHQLFSRTPHYNTISKQYELDFRDRGRTGLRIQSSVKNFQITLEENGRQTILQLGRVGKSKFVMDYRYPLTGYQAFCICLASIDSKLCCTI